MCTSECDTRQEGMKKKRGTNVYSESSEYQSDSDDSISRQVFAGVSCFTSSLTDYGNASFICIFIFIEFKCMRGKRWSFLYRSGKCLVGQEINLATCSPRNLNFTHVTVHRHVTVLLCLNIKSNTTH